MQRGLRGSLLLAVSGLLAISGAVVAPAAHAAPSSAPTVVASPLALTATWSPSDYPLAFDPSFKVELIQSSAVVGSSIVSGSTPTLSASFTKLNPSLSYTISVSELDNFLPVVDGQATSLPASPLGIAAPVQAKPIAGNDSVRLSWSAVPAPAGSSISYRILRNGFQTTPAQSCVGQLCSATDSGLTNGTSYTYTIVADAPYTRPASGTASSAPSNARSAIPVSVPSAPGKPMLVARDRALSIAWGSSTDNGGLAITKYRLFTHFGVEIGGCSARTTTVCLARATLLTRSGTIRNLQAGVTQSYYVKAENSVGLSSRSGYSAWVAPFTTVPPFSYGMKGAAITALQLRLNWAGLATPLTGVFDSATRDQVNHLREKYLYERSGIVTPELWKLLRGITSSNGALPSQCRGTMICISKTQEVLRYLVNGKVVLTLDARFGPEGSGGLSTGEGMFAIDRKEGCSGNLNAGSSYGAMLANCHVSTGYGTPMPWSMFFNGGQAIHYSYFFNQDGYWGHSHGCVNIRNWNGIHWLYNNADYGTPVYVYR